MRFRQEIDKAIEAIKASPSGGILSGWCRNSDGEICRRFRFSCSMVGRMAIDFGFNQPDAIRSVELVDAVSGTLTSLRFVVQPRIKLLYTRRDWRIIPTISSASAVPGKIPPAFETV